MALDSYAALQGAVQAYIDREDFAARVPDFIRMAEAEFDRRLSGPEMEARAVAQTVAGAQRLPLPTDFAQVRSVTLQTDPPFALQGMGVSSIHDGFAGYLARPVGYAISDQQLWLGPIPDAAYGVQIVYRRRLPKLSDTVTTNWLLERHPDLYLFGAVAQSEFYGWNDNRLGLVKARVDEIIEQVNRDGRRQAWPAGARIPTGVRCG